MTIIEESKLNNDNDLSNFKNIFLDDTRKKKHRLKAFEEIKCNYSNSILINDTDYKIIAFLFLSKKTAYVRSDIVMGCEIPRSTIYDRLDRLTFREVIISKSAKENKAIKERGRPKVLWSLTEHFAMNLFDMELYETARIKMREKKRRSNNYQKLK